MNLADLEAARKENCICGEKGLFFALHLYECPFYKMQEALHEEMGVDTYNYR